MTILDALKVLDRVPLALEQLHRALLEARRFVLGIPTFLEPKMPLLRSWMPSSCL